MDIDLTQYSLQELEELETNVRKAKEEKAESNRKAAYAEAQKVAAQFGYSLTDIMPASATSGSGKKAGGSKAKVNPPKYRNPDDPEQTWTGKGRQPAWIREAREAGKDIEEFKIAS